MRRTAAGSAVSTRPMYYGGGAAATSYLSSNYQQRAIVWSAVAVTGIWFYGRSSRPTCGEGTFAFGHSCRDCSQWECPVGQYRAQCTPYSDSYCKKCTNAPQDPASTYTTPGNDNDCEFVSTGEIEIVEDEAGAGFRDPAEPAGWCTCMLLLVVGCVFACWLVLFVLLTTCC